mgnify:CR=1 FL=1
MTKRKTTDKEGKEAPRSSFTFVAPGDDSLVPILAAGGKNSITPPSRGGDKTSRDRDRYKERQKGKLKGKIGDIIGDNPIITRPGKINVPVPPESEPIWRPGRDQSGKGGGGKPDMAQAGGTQPENLPAALAGVTRWIEGKL